MVSRRCQPRHGAAEVPRGKGGVVRRSMAAGSGEESSAVGGHLLGRPRKEAEQRAKRAVPSFAPAGESERAPAGHIPAAAAVAATGAKSAAAPLPSVLALQTPSSLTRVWKIKPWADAWGPIWRLCRWQRRRGKTWRLH
jgi:hypothetical protein